MESARVFHLPGRYASSQTDRGAQTCTRAFYSASGPELALNPFANLERWYADPDAKPDIKAELYGYSVWLFGFKSVTRTRRLTNAFTLKSVTHRPS